MPQCAPFHPGRLYQGQALPSGFTPSLSDQYFGFTWKIHSLVLKISIATAGGSHTSMVSSCIRFPYATPESKQMSPRSSAHAAAPRAGRP
jgi:hypothetical protein